MNSLEERIESETIKQRIKEVFFSICILTVFIASLFISLLSSCETRSIGTSIKLISPIDSLTFIWNSSERAEQYKVQKLVNNFVQKEVITKDTSIKLSVKALGEYEIKVRAENSAGNSKWHSSKDSTAAFSGWVYINSKIDTTEIGGENE